MCQFSRLLSSRLGARVQGGLKDILKVSASRSKGVPSMEEVGVPLSRPLDGT